MMDALTMTAQTEAERLLPCVGSNGDIQCNHGRLVQFPGQPPYTQIDHAEDCPAGYRPSVAAALAAKDAEIARLKEHIAVPDQYRHYKGDIYELLAIVDRAGDGEPMAVYRHAVTKRMWTRPMAEFQEKFTALSRTDKPEDGG